MPANPGVCLANLWRLFCGDELATMIDKREVLPSVLQVKPSNQIDAGPVLITPLERYALQLIARAATPAQVAEMLRLAPAHIEPFLAALFARLGAASRFEAINVASRRGLLTPSSNSGTNDAFAHKSNELT